VTEDWTDGLAVSLSQHNSVCLWHKWLWLPMTTDPFS